MSDDNAAVLPPVWRELQARSAEVGFGMSSDSDTGALLRMLAATRRTGLIVAARRASPA